MSLYQQQEYDKTELQKQIETSLKEKNKKISLGEENLVDNSSYLKGTKKTTSLIWLWIVIFIIFSGIAFWLVYLGLENR